MRHILLTLLGLFSICSAIPSLAEPIQVLISISDSSTQQSFEGKVRRQLKRSGFEEKDFKITLNSDQFDLYQALTAHETQALIWISHGAVPHFSWKTKRKLKGTSGMSALPELIDYRGDNVAPIFKIKNDHLKYLAVIGCNSQQILDYVGSDLGQQDGQIAFIPSSRVIGQLAIRQAIRNLPESFPAVTGDHANDPDLKPELKEYLKISRTIPIESTEEMIRPLRMMMGETILGVIPAAKPGQTITQTISFQGQSLNSIRLETGQPIMTDPSKIEFGLIEIETSAGKKMKPFTKMDGTPFGLNFRLYLSP